jgi:hypothetical protein
MSLSDTPRREAAGAGRMEARLAPDGAITLGPALIERTANAIEAEVRALTLSDRPSLNLSFLDGRSVRANAPSSGGSETSRSDSRSPRHGVEAVEDVSCD